MSSVVHIKNMVCPRCNAAVQQIFDKLEVEVESVYLGGASLVEELSKDQLSELDQLLLQSGFERIDDKKSQLLENIKTSVIDVIHHKEHFQLQVNWSDYLSEQLNQDYHYLSTLFSSISGITLEQYIIKQKIEKVKEYLIYDELSVKEIAFRLGYSSVAHLSAQFKKVTGMAPSLFKQLHHSNGRQSIDSIS
ncbi:MAG: AraC family transcriptional regulator [Reichenbachiella sp.]|uniref:AraC family transcriptional regulator n=1 Tax=Reichenbachiella sp. TaxID=2184521 RepID=UPI00329705B9